MIATPITISPQTGSAMREASRVLPLEELMEKGQPELPATGNGAATMCDPTLLLCAVAHCAYKAVTSERNDKRD